MTMQPIPLETDTDADLGAPVEMFWDGELEWDDLDPEDQQLVLAQAKVAKADEAPTGAMVALWVGTDDRFGPVPEQGNLHITLVFLGKAADLDESGRTNALRVVQEWAMQQSPLAGKAHGLVRWSTPDGDCIGAAVDMPGLGRSRADLEIRLRHMRIPLPSEHDFTPHVTLEYVRPTAGRSPLPDDVPLLFTSVLLRFGAEDHFVELGTGETVLKYNHAHDARGRFATGSANVSDTEVGGRAQANIAAYGGTSIHRVTGWEPKTGFMVSRQGHEEVIGDASKVTPEHIAGYMKRHAKALDRPENFMGGWIDLSDGKLYLDVSQRIAPGKGAREKAMALGRRRKQLAIFDAAKGEEIRMAKKDAARVTFTLPKDDPAEAARIIRQIAQEHGKH